MRSLTIARALFILLLVLASAACQRTPVAQLATPEPFQPIVRFQAYDRGNGNPADMTFQINPLAAGARTQFLKLGETIAGTTIRLTDFDASAEELIVTDTASHRVAKLKLPNGGKPVDSPRTF